MLESLLSITFDKGFYLAIELYIVSVIVLIFTFVLIDLKLDKTENNKHFKRFFLATIVSVVSDFPCYILDSLAMSNLRWINIIFNIIYISTSMILSYEWFVFALSKMGYSIINNKKFSIFLKSIVLAHVLISIVSAKTGWMYYVDENGVYQRGILFILQLVPWILPTIIAVLAIIKFLSKKEVGNKKIYGSMIAYTMFPIVCEIFQLIGGGSPSISFGYTVGAVFMYILLLEDSISSDQLTGLNNRTYMFKYLNAKLKNLSKIDESYLFMLDINDFKKINDKHGHIEGDKALKTAANELKKIEKNYSSYISRFGGDEFMLLIDNINEDRCKEIINEINNNLSSICKENKYKYSLSFSAGYCKCEQEHTKDISKLIEKADHMLYVNKNIYKKATNK